MIGVLHSGILSIVIDNCSELCVKPTGEVCTRLEPGVKFRISTMGCKMWEQDVVNFAEKLQEHVCQCERCKSQPLGIHILSCFNK
jgi:hypothetical protein